MAGLTSAAALLSSITGPIANVATALGTVATAVDAVKGLRSHESEQEQVFRQLQEQQYLQQKQAAENAALDREKISAQADVEEKRRQRALKNAVARQRANFGAKGISTDSSASAQAVLLGTFDESEEDAANRDRLDQLRLKTLDQNTSQLAQRNLLAQTQLAEKQKLQRILNGE